MEDLKTIWKLAVQVRSFIVDMTDGNYEVQEDLCGACGIASYTLVHVLNLNNIKSELVAGCYGDDEFGVTINHCWVETGIYIVDITAGQFFGNKDIEIKLKPSDAYTPVLRGRKAMLDFKRWPEYQQPKRYHKEIKEYTKRIKASESPRSSQISSR